ncbi:XRE family transcriptional regulator [Ectothiorhodospiraceae bacterium WFHF3C12]|nr:XRE family transcriptional regulator [Ectothiorhodospiraceae bacterium WFHF3C12]
MTDGQRFNSVWDALEDTPEKAENLKVRAELINAVREVVNEMGLSQGEAAKRLGITQPRLSDLLRGRIDRFSLDALVNILARAGKHVEIRLKSTAA